MFHECDSRKRISDLAFLFDAFKVIGSGLFLFVPSLRAFTSRQGPLRSLRKSNVMSVSPQGALIDVEGATQELPDDFVFILIGEESPEDFLRGAGVEIVEKSLGNNLEGTFA